MEFPLQQTVDPDFDPLRTARRSGLNPLHLLFVLAGGALGTFARQGIEAGFPTDHQVIGQTVLIVNAVGCLFIGLLVGAYFQQRNDHVGARLFLTTGILGGWTTYGGVTVLSLTLAHRGSVPEAMGLWALTLLTNIGFASLGFWLGNLVRTRRA